MINKSEKILEMYLTSLKGGIIPNVEKMQKDILEIERFGIEKCEILPYICTKCGNIFQSIEMNNSIKDEVKSYIVMCGCTKVRKETFSETILEWCKLTDYFEEK